MAPASDTAQDLSKLSREELDDLASGAGVPDPGELANKEAVIEAIKQTGVSAGVPAESAEPEASDAQPESSAPEAVAQVLKATPAKDDEKEPVSRLIEQAPEFFSGHSAHVAAGAFSCLPEGTTELTRKQAAAVIDAWLKSPVS